MNFPVDLSLFRNSKHSPTLPMLEKSMSPRRSGSNSSSSSSSNSNSSSNSDQKLIDYCIPANPYFPTAPMMKHFRDRLEYILKFYPDAQDQPTEALAHALSLPTDGIVLANGSTELITWIDQLFLRESLATPVPTFGRWTDQPEESGKRIFPFFLRASSGFELGVDAFCRFTLASGARAAAICNPNNPTGTFLTLDQVRETCHRLRSLDLIVIDESFLDFSQTSGIPTASMLAYQSPNVIVLKSLGKNFGLHGLRAGYAVANPALAARLRKALPRWNVNALAIELIYAYRDNIAAYDESRIRVIEDRVAMEKALRTVPGIGVYASHANFNYIRIPDAVPGAILRDHLLTENGILIRDCGTKIGANAQYFRVATRPREEQARLIRALTEALARLSPRKQTKAFAFE